MSAISPNKKLGQHFLIDQSIPKKICQNLQKNIEIIIEIGAGKGILTEQLLLYQTVIAIEFDRKLIDFLKQKFTVEIANKKLVLIHHDILTFDWDRIIQKNKKYCLIGNLPYNISIKIIKNIIAIRQSFQQIIFMVQKEVADRLLHDGLQKNIKNYGSLSVIIQLMFKTKAILDVAPMEFEPPPKIISTVISMLPNSFVINDELQFFHFVQHLFQNRRKRFLSNLEKIYPKIFSQLDDEAKLQWLSVRAENILPKEYYALYQKYLQK